MSRFTSISSMSTSCGLLLHDGVLRSRNSANAVDVIRKKIFIFVQNKPLISMKLTSGHLLLLTSIIFLSNSLHSQDDRDFRVGLKVYPGFDWIKARTSNVKKDGSGIGFSFGIMSDIRLADNYFFTPEINITTITSKTKMKDTAVYTLPGSGTYNQVSYK